MKYRKNPKNGDMLSILGFGCMRFPKNGNAVDEERAKLEIKKAIENGINYFDTAYIYHGGKSEGILGDALVDGLREKVKIATKLPPFMVRKAEDIDKIFDTQLKRLKTTYIDYYLIHMLADTNMWNRLCELGIKEWILKKKANGEIRNIGFSFHGGKEDFRSIIDSYDWDFCQIQYNYLDENNQAGKEGLLYAAAKNMPVIIMEPLRGGKIISDMPDALKKLWSEAKPKRSVAEWALRWVWNHKEMTLLLSGMTTEEQLEENCRIADSSDAEVMTEEELNLFKDAREMLSKITKVNCTACGYCMPCPSGVDIPSCFSAYNDYHMKKSFMRKMSYIMNLGASSKNPAIASRCVKCRKCEKHCPQNIKIADRMTDVVKDMESFPFKLIVFFSKIFMK